MLKSVMRMPIESYLAESDQAVADQNVDVLAGGPGHADHAARLEAEDLAQGHYAAVEFHRDIQKNVGKRGDFVEDCHGRFATVSASG
jgi:hypothetical protein